MFYRITQPPGQCLFLNPFSRPSYHMHPSLRGSIVSIFRSVEPGNHPLCPPFTVWNQAIFDCVHISQCGPRQSPIVSTFHSVKQAIFHCVHISQCETRNRPLCPTITVWNQATSHRVQPSQCGTRQPPIVSNLHSVETGNLPSCPIFTVWNQATKEAVRGAYLQPYRRSRCMDLSLF